MELQSQNEGGTPGQQGVGFFLNLLSAAVVGGGFDVGSGGLGCDSDAEGRGDGSSGGHPEGQDGRDPQKQKTLRREGRLNEPNALVNEDKPQRKKTMTQKSKINFI